MTGRWPGCEGGGDKCVEQEQRLDRDTFGDSAVIAAPIDGFVAQRDRVRGLQRAQQ